ncbi:hypothetical protein ANCCAN_00342 [Ancylostoma caninum]|uniref:Tyrosine-protein phosphatase domain-containing protein n=1 Tax=Ancylostoma caninum TaxID=29170 RepID=A0A368H9J5_ANCCA|nr:hypothetical protein ANCCAN_00342 [Ancylostoma caninum]
MRQMSPDEPSVIVSILFIKFTKADGTTEQREVRHYQWQDWPDRGVPPCRLTTMQYLFIHRVMLCYFLEKHRKRYESILTEENQAKYRKFVEEYNIVTGTN